MPNSNTGRAPPVLFWYVRCILVGLRNMQGSLSLLTFSEAPRITACPLSSRVDAYKDSSLLQYQLCLGQTDYGSQIPHRMWRRSSSLHAVKEPTPFL